MSHIDTVLVANLTPQNKPSFFVINRLSRDCPHICPLKRFSFRLVIVAIDQRFRLRLPIITDRRIE